MPVVLPPVQERKILLHLPIHEDPDQSAYASIRLATNGEQEEIATLNEEEVLSLNERGRATSMKRRFNVAELRRKQAFLTMVDCNITKPDPDFPDDRSKDTPLFRFRRIDGRIRIDMKEEEFKESWGMLPPVWSDAIIGAVFEVNKQWDPNPEKRGE